MKIIVELHNFHELFMEMLPWTDNFDEAGLVRSLIDDLNGILNLTVDIAEQRPVDYGKISNTMDYLCTESSITNHLSQAGLHDMKLAVVNALIKMFKELSRIDGWVNNRYRLVNYSFRPRASREHLHLVLEVVVASDYPRHIQRLMIESANRALEAFCDWDSRSTSR
jgi:hypothetical protein